MSKIEPDPSVNIDEHTGRLVPPEARVPLYRINKFLTCKAKKKWAEEQCGHPAIRGTEYCYKHKRPNLKGDKKFIESHHKAHLKHGYDVNQREKRSANSKVISLKKFLTEKP